MTPNRSIRVANPLWFAALAKAGNRGETVADVVNRALTEYVENDDESSALARSLRMSILANADILADVAANLRGAADQLDRMPDWTEPN